MTSCSKCGHINDGSSKFCNMCGQELGGEPTDATSPPSEESTPTRQCKQCGHLNPSANRYCLMCRADLESDKPRTTSSIPPSMPPIQNPVSFAPPQSYAAPRYKLPKWTIVAVAASVLFFIALGILGAWNEQMHSGVFVDGKELTRHEASAGLDEMDQISLHINSHQGDLSNFTTTSPLSTKFLAFYNALQDAQAKLDTDGGTADANQIISIQLGSIEGRKKSRRDHEILKKALSTYFDVVHQDLANLDDFVGNLLGPTKGHIVCNLAGRIEKVQIKCRDLFNIRGELINFMDQAKPTLEDGHFLFEREAELSKFKELVKRHDDCAEAFQQATTEYEKLVAADTQSVQRQIREMTKGLG